MALHDLTAWRHEHDFDPGHRGAEWRTWAVVAITAVTMLAEIVGGWLTGSMALLADGWHMGTHVAALALAGVAYALARRWSRDARFTFGTWKIEVLGAFSSALVLGIVAIAMAVESTLRLLSPQPIAFGAALAVAFIGLVVNVVSALVLSGAEHDHGHDHDHGHAPGLHAHDHDHAHAHGHAPGPHAHDHAHQGDLNLRAAYLHVLADALTSVLAIVALAAGMLAGWSWLDPAMGIVGSGVIAWWSKGLIVQSARVLLDREMDAPVTAQVRSAIEGDGDAEIADLHVWRVGRARYACIVTIVAREPLTPDGYRERLAGIAALAHVSVEVNRCPHLRCP
jgi:cation diffusion facilitator family transporter